MFIVSARYLFLCDENFSILDNQGFVFDEKILEFGTAKHLRQKYPQAKIIPTPPNSLILPAFINSHTHLEFSANSYTLHFGKFLPWLKSVMAHRQNLSQEAKDALLLKTLQGMLRSGTGTVGEISSFGSDLAPCVGASKRGMRIVFFNEILGANEAGLEEKKQDFLRRFEASMTCKSELFIPALSLHAPYSTHKKLAHFALEFAKKNRLLVSTHFLESRAENLWLRGAEGGVRRAGLEGGGFKKWLSSLSQNPSPSYTPAEFIGLFKGLRTLFTHCVYLKEWALLDPKLHAITHCAFSNRLLSQGTFALKRALKSGLNVHLGTDGLSSNISLSMLDELRANLLIHADFDLEFLAKKLLLMATLYPARALNLNLGTLEEGKEADFSVFTVGECDKAQLPLQFILNAKGVEKIFIRGRSCEF